MAVKIADAFIDVMLNTDQIDAQLASIEGRISGIQSAASAALSTANAAASSASSAVAQAQAAASSVASAGSGTSGGGGFGGFSTNDAIDLALDFVPLPGVGTATKVVRRGASSVFRRAQNIPGVNAVKNFFTDNAVGKEIGSALVDGGKAGIEEATGRMQGAMRQAIKDTVQAGKDEAEISSPSRKAAREIGGPIMAGITSQVQLGGVAVANAMTNSISYAISKSAADLFGGTFISRNAQFVPGGDGTIAGNFSGIPSYIGQFGNAVGNSFAVGNPQSFGQGSRILASNFPDKVRDFGQGLLSSAVGSVLPGFAAGPVSDMLGTMLGTKPILTAEQALSAPKSADAGGFTDSPFVGGQFVFNNSINAGNFTDTERAVQLGILQSMRRLGVGF